MPGRGVSRRQAAAAALLPAAALLAGAWPAHAAGGSRSSSAAAAVGAGTGSSPAPNDAGSFYSRWQYVQPADILPFLRATATPGDTESVLQAIDRFAEFFPMFRWQQLHQFLLSESAGRTCMGAPP